MKIYFVRHGKTEYNGTGRITGQTDIPLIDAGIREAEEATKNIPPDITALYSSDLIRCKQTVEILNKKLQLPVMYDSRLRERDFGSLAGSMWEDIDPNGILRAKDTAQQYDYSEFGGETFEDVRKRVFAFVDDVRTNHKNELVLAVTSAGIIRMLHHVMNEQIQEIIHNSSFHEFEFPD